jgi:hypothetical protein
MNWLKVELATPNKPEMDRVMAMCKCSRAEAFLAFFNFYAWADETTEDGTIQFLTPGVVDDRSGLVGFGDALRDVGWVKYTGRVGQIQNWERHNGKSAKKRLVDAERVRRFRGKRKEAGEVQPKTISQAMEDAAKDGGAANWSDGEPVADPVAEPEAEEEEDVEEDEEGRRL